MPDEMPQSDNGIGIKEFLLRIESNLKDEIISLRSEVAAYQERSVTRTEHEKAVDHIYKEFDRIERRVDQNHSQWKEELNAFKRDLKDGQQRLVVVAGLIFVAVQFMLTWLI